MIGVHMELCTVKDYRGCRGTATVSGWRQCQRLAPTVVSERRRAAIKCVLPQWERGEMSKRWVTSGGGGRFALALRRRSHRANIPRDRCLPALAIPLMQYSTLLRPCNAVIRYNVYNRPPVASLSFSRPLPPLSRFASKATPTSLITISLERWRMARDASARRVPFPMMFSNFCYVFGALENVYWVEHVSVIQIKWWVSVMLSGKLAFSAHLFHAAGRRSSVADRATFNLVAAYFTSVYSDAANFSIISHTERSLFFSSNYIAYLL